MVLTGCGRKAKEDAKKLAAWEVAARAAKAFQLRYKLQGWTGSADALWFDNELVTVKDKVLGINGDYLVTTVEYVLNSSGSVVNLTLADPDTYIPKPNVPKKSQALGWANS